MENCGRWQGGDGFDPLCHGRRMEGEKLPKEDIAKFKSWEENLPDYEKGYLNHPGLSNVLDIHANKLYEEAATYYNQRQKCRSQKKKRNNHRAFVFLFDTHR